MCRRLAPGHHGRAPIIPHVGRIASAPPRPEWYKRRGATQAPRDPDSGKGHRVDLEYSLALGVAAAAAAILGSMLGLGGGVFIVPIFTLYLDVDPKIAVGASALAVVTNSVVGSSNHLRNGFTNIRLSMLLQVTTAMGAIAGAIIAIWVNASILKVVLGAILVYAAVSMVRGRRRTWPNAAPTDPDPLSLGASYVDTSSGKQVRYIPQRLPLGLGISTGAGVLSGMLGIGGGVIQVPMMNLVMRMPVKAAAGTSSFMVGMTAVATAAVFYSEGKLDPQVAVPAMLGVFVGSQFGSTLTRRLRTERLIIIFFIILTYLGLSMVLDAFGLNPFG